MTELLRVVHVVRRPKMKSVEEIMNEEGIPTEKKIWIDRLFPQKDAYGFEEAFDDLSDEEVEVLRKKYEYEDDRSYYDALGSICDELDEGAFYDLTDMYLPEEITSEMEALYKPRRKLKTMDSWLSKAQPIKTSKNDVYITEKAFNQLRQIAWREYLHRNAESAAFVYGKNGVITKAKQYLCKGSPGLVSGNALDIIKQMQKRGFMGVFHSHVFSSAAPSGTDKECLNGWTTYARNFGCDDPISLIGCLPYFKQRAYSLDEKLVMQEVGGAHCGAEVQFLYSSLKNDD